VRRTLLVGDVGEEAAGFVSLLARARLKERHNLEHSDLFGGLRLGLVCELFVLKRNGQ
jgi:hypothetical protein